MKHSVCLLVQRSVSLSTWLVPPGIARPRGLNLSYLNFSPYLNRAVVGYENESQDRWQFPQKCVKLKDEGNKKTRIKDSREYHGGSNEVLKAGKERKTMD